MLASRKIYIGIDPQSVTVADLSDVAAATQSPATVLTADGRTLAPFSHPRVIIGDFASALSVLQQAYAASGIKRSLAAPEIFIHWRGNAAGGVAGIEARALQELAQALGARKATVITQEGALDASDLEKLKH